MIFGTGFRGVAFRKLKVSSVEELNQALDAAVAEVGSDAEWAVVLWN